MFPGLSPWLARARSIWGVYKIAFVSDEDEGLAWKRQISACSACQPPSEWCMAEFGAPRAAFPLLWDWINRGMITFDGDKPLAAFLKVMESQPLDDPQTVGRAVASLLWHLSRRGQYHEAPLAGSNPRSTEYDWTGVTKL